MAAAPDMTEWDVNAGGEQNIGGDDVVWTGGSHIMETNRQSASCFRPEALRDAVKAEERCTNGLPKERQIDITSDNKMPLATWLREIKHFME